MEEFLFIMSPRAAAMENQYNTQHSAVNVNASVSLLSAAHAFKRRSNRVCYVSQIPPRGLAGHLSAVIC